MAASCITWYEFSRSGADTTMSKPLASLTGSQRNPRHQRDHARVCVGREKEAVRVRSRRGRSDHLSGKRLPQRVVEWVAGQNRSGDEFRGMRAMACSLDGAEHELLEEDFQHVDLA